MVRVHRLFALLLAGIVAISLTACNPGQFRKDNAQVPRFVYSVVIDPKTFNEVLSEESPNVFTLISEGLVAQNGVTGELEPGLAESWEISEDNLKIVFTLRDGLRWSDGEPLTADDFVFTYNDIIFNLEIPTSTRDVLRVGDKGLLPEVAKLDNRRIQFMLPEPFAPFMRIAGSISPMPQHVLADSIRQKGSEGKPLFLSTWDSSTNPQSVVCNGPYQLSSYVPGQRVVFKRNPHYWRKDEQGNQQPYIEEIVWEIVENPNASLAQFRSGGLDVVAIPPNDFQLLKREEDRGDFTIFEGGPAFGTRFITFNLNRGWRNGKPVVDPIKSAWFTDVKFRQAIAYGIDRDTLLNNLYRGIGEPQHSPISVQSPYYFSPEEGLKTYEYNPDKSRELLTEAGFTYMASGQLVDTKGNPVRFVLITSAESLLGQAIVSQIKRDLEKIGIRVDVQPLSFTVLVDKLDTTLDWDCVFIGFTGGIEPNSGANIWQPEGRLHMFNLASQPGQTPLEGREVYAWEAEIGQLYTQAARELDDEKRKALYAQTQQLTQEYLPVIFMINPLSMAAVRNRVKGVKYTALGRTLWNVYELKLVDGT
ncbi:MAG: ABC transporter substrate-binding protein [Leptolyngbyaceae cyanobacterium MO_188.B28]|nr:ABC transporter substrate-binding protein [Leptolyngbyaceae cyanobacterium MO_188.B28]